MKFSDIRLSSDGLKNTKPSEWLVRFVFGGTISVLIFFASQKFGPLLGGLLLGFPSILPATVTLVQKKEGRDQAQICAFGAAMGSVGLVGFAITLYFVAQNSSAFISFLTASLVWILISIAALVVGLFLRGVKE